jgi:hypothetical protein
MIYPAGTCPPATETNPRFAPSVLFERDHFPNVHTFHIQWAGSLAQNGAGNGLQLPWDPKGYPKMRNFILDIDFSSAGDMVALLQHFNFPNLTTFTQKISLGQQTVRFGCENLGKIMQMGMPMNWSSLKTLKLEMNINAGSVLDVSLCVCFPSHVECCVENLTHCSL